MLPPSDSSLGAWLRYIETLHHQDIELGLERLQQVKQRFIAPEQVPFVFTVAGTNGKGTTTALLSALCQQADARVGWYSSPHLLQFNERIRINNIPVTDQQLVSAFQRVETVRGQVPLTYFEYTTLAAFVIFIEADLDAWVLEVGLGGRLDAVNSIAPNIAVVTNIALDHQQYLGDDLPAIAREKFAIARTGRPLVTGSPDIPAAALAEAVAAGAKPYPYGDSHYAVDDRLCWQRREISAPRLPLPAANAATALQAFALSPFKLVQEEILHCLRRNLLPGRLQQLEVTGRKVILDVGHNPHAGDYIASQLAADSYHLVLGMLTDKDCRGFAAALAPIARTFSTLSLEAPRGLTAAALAERLQRPVERQFFDFSGVFDYFDTHYPGENLFIGGSFYTVLHALNGLET